MGEVLARVEGSKGMYDITMGNDGVVYCACWAWKMSKERPKTCKHLREFLASKAKPKTPTTPTPVSVTATTGSMKTANEVISSVDPKTWDVEEGS